MATLVAELDPSVFLDLTRELMRKRLPKNCDRAQAGAGKSQAFGIIRRWSYRPHLSRNTWMRPYLWKLLLDFADHHVPIAWDGVTVNDDYTSAPHTDKGNEGDSYTVSFGDFTGGELCLDGPDGEIKIATKHRGYLFNGATLRHWTAPHIGRRFCLVFYKIIWPPKFLPRYKVSCRQVPTGLEITDEYDDSIVIVDTKGHLQAVLRDPQPREWIGRLTQKGQKSRVGVEHMLASACISDPGLPFGF